MDESVDRISIHPEICHGKPCIKGTRIPVELILGLIEDGADIAEILDMYPHLIEEDIIAYIQYARILVQNVPSCSF